MLNTNHWANILQPDSSQAPPARSFVSTKFYCTPDFSEKKVGKITATRQLTNYLESAYPNWVTVDHLLTLPFLKSKEKPAVLTMLQHVHDKHPLEARAGVKQAFYHGPLCKEYRLVKGAE